VNYLAVRWVNYLAKTPSAWVNCLAAGWVNYLATKGLKWVNCLAVDIPARRQLVKEINRRTVSNCTQSVYSPLPDDWVRILLNKPRLRLSRIAY